MARVVDLMMSVAGGGGRGGDGPPAPVPPPPPTGFPQWWDDLEDNPTLQLYTNYGIGAAYAVVCLVALVQLIRIQMRVPEYGWTTQKVFHLLNALVCGLRAGTFLARPALDAAAASASSFFPPLARLALFDVPGLLFFTTYTLLVLFWAEIYHQARSMPTGALRPAFVGANLAVYGVQAVLWVFESKGAGGGGEGGGGGGAGGGAAPAAHALSAAFLAAVSLAAAAGFLLYGGRLFLMLQRFPIESRGRKKKLREVGLVTVICACCFSLRAMLVAASALDARELSLDVASHPLVNLAYYGLAELLPAACVLYILRKLPPKRQQQGGYEPIPSAQDAGGGGGGAGGNGEAAAA